MLVGVSMVVFLSSDVVMKMMCDDDLRRYIIVVTSWLCVDGDAVR